jgi:hypothetical protein
MTVRYVSCIITKLPGEMGKFGDKVLVRKLSGTCRNRTRGSDFKISVYPVYIVDYQNNAQESCICLPNRSKDCTVAAYISIPGFFQRFIDLNWLLIRFG